MKISGLGKWHAGTEKKGRASQSGAKTSPTSRQLHPPTLIHFPPYLAANYEGKEGNKKRAEEGAFPPLSLFCLVRFAAQHDIAERTHEWNGVKEGGWCVGQGRTEEGCC